MVGKKFHILLIDDHTLFRQGLKLLLADLRSDIHFTDLDNCEQLSTLSGVKYDIVLLDYYLPGINGAKAIDAVLDSVPVTPVVVLSSEDDPAVIRESIVNGASGYIPKSSTQDIMIAALKLILAGGTYLPTHVLDREILNIDVTEKKDHGLSERQIEVLLKAVKGMPNKLIGEEMGIAEGTVKAHLSSTYRLLGVNNRTEAVFAVAKLGLGPTESS
ncbi:MAG: response regulator transcription factor [Gammaproteobacteria bacterium]